MYLLGTITYNIARDWDLDTILKRLEALKYPGVELRTGHKHGVEIGLSAEQRREVRKKFDDSPVDLAGLGSAFEYHSADPAEVRRNIDGTKAYVRLAHDIGSPGVKVRPNGVPRGESARLGVPTDRQGTSRGGQGRAGLRDRDPGGGPRGESQATCRTWRRSSSTPTIPTSTPAGIPIQARSTRMVRSPRISKLLAGKIREVHLRDLTDDTYPWVELFGLLKGINYNGYTLAEIGESADPDRVLRYFRSLWMAYVAAAKSS